MGHTTSSGSTFSYDANGNQIQRVISGQTYTLTYDSENHLTGVSGAATATFVYDGDGQRVKATIGGTTTAYLGSYFEWNGSTSTMVKYFYASGKRVAMKKGSTVYFLLSDHLGSTTLTTNSSGAYSAELRYKAWGETRYTSGTTQTQRRYTGQIEESALGLYYFNARFYDPLIGRFITADSIVPEPGNPQAWDRYAYTFNNPLKYTDPSGHMICDKDGNCSRRFESIETALYKYGVLLIGAFNPLQKLAILGAVGAVADKLGGASPFRIVYKTIDTLMKVVKGLSGARYDCANIGSGGCTTSSHQINFVSMAGDGYTGYAGYLINRNNMVHELGHAFNGAVGGDPYKNLDAAMLDNPNLQRGTEKGTYYGFASPYMKHPLTWQMSVTDASISNEIFADMFLGWTFDTWYSGNLSTEITRANARRDWMNNNMPGWIP